MANQRFVGFEPFWHAPCKGNGGLSRKSVRERGKQETHMKYIIAIIKPHRLEHVREALAAIGIEGMTVSEVKGHGRQKGHTEVYRGAEYVVNFLPKVKIEVATTEDMLDKALEAIREAAQTGQIGDGKIFVLPIEKTIRVRTGETDHDAL